MKNIPQNLYPKFETQSLTMISGKKNGSIFFTHVFCKHSFLLENSSQYKLMWWSLQQVIHSPTLYLHITLVYFVNSVCGQNTWNMMHLSFTNQSLFPLCERQYIFVAAEFGLPLVGEWVHPTVPAFLKDLSPRDWNLKTSLHYTMNTGYTYS